MVFNLKSFNLELWIQRNVSFLKSYKHILTNWNLLWYYHAIAFRKDVTYSKFAFSFAIWNKLVIQYAQALLFAKKNYAVFFCIFFDFSNVLTLIFFCCRLRMCNTLTNDKRFGYHMKRNSAFPFYSATFSDSHLSS